MNQVCIGLALLVVFACAAAAPIPKGAGERPKLDPKDLADAYEGLMKSREGGPDAAKHSEQFRAALRKAAPALPIVEAVKGEPKTYAKLVMNQHKKQLDAFTFKTPPGKENWDMNWEFVLPPGALKSWYILPKEGTMSGFRTFNTQNDYQEKGANLPEKNRRYIQPLDGGHLKPNTEYIIWFTFAKEEPFDMHVRIGVTEPKPKEQP
jgi:hypothetical protein